MHAPGQQQSAWKSLGSSWYRQHTTTSNTPTSPALACNQHQTHTPFTLILGPPPRQFDPEDAVLSNPGAAAGALPSLACGVWPAGPDGSPPDTTGGPSPAGAAASAGIEVGGVAGSSDSAAVAVGGAAVGASAAETAFPPPPPIDRSSPDSSPLGCGAGGAAASTCCDCGGGHEEAEGVTALAAAGAVVDVEGEWSHSTRGAGCGGGSTSRYGGTL